MKKILAVASTIGLLVPAFAFAASDSVTLTTDTVLSVGGVTLNISGSSATVESITVNASDFSFTLQSGSSIQVTAPNLNQLAASTAIDKSTDTCNTTDSILKYVGTAERTITITPLGALCSATIGGGTIDSSPSSSSSSSSSSGGSSSASTPAATPATPAVLATPATPAVAATPAKSASGLSATQIQSILDVLASFDADAETIAKVKASLEGTVVVGSVTSNAVSIFKADLTIGSLGSEVKALQEYLNAHGYTISTSGPGSSGNETTKFGALTRAALVKYQKAKGITPAAGYFGPKTRATVNSDK